MCNFTKNTFTIIGAREYECLLRWVYHCGPGGVKGADADIYRKLEHAEAHLTSFHWNKTQEQKEYDYGSAFAEIRMYVLRAIRDGLEK